MVARIVAKRAAQKDLDLGLKINNKALVDVQWLDACAHMNVEALDKGKLEDFLCITHTVGKVVAQDDNVICVANNFSKANGVDLIAIPVKWIKSIKILEAG